MTVRTPVWPEVLCGAITEAITEGITEGIYGALEKYFENEDEHRVRREINQGFTP